MADLPLSFWKRGVGFSVPTTRREREEEKEGYL